VENTNYGEPSGVPAFHGPEALDKLADLVAAKLREQKLESLPSKQAPLP